MKISTGIYKITNPKNMVYTGQSVNIENRFKGYRRSNGHITQSRLHASFLEYGVENHKFEIICICEVSELNKYERYYQQLYCVLNENGLNCNIIGCGGVRNTRKPKGDLTDIEKQTRIRIGKSIANFRNKRGLSQVKLSTLSGVGHSHIARIELGKYNVGIDTLFDIGKALGIRIDFVDKNS